MDEFMDPDDMAGYYICLEAGDAFFHNRKRLWIADQLDYLLIQEWCFDMNWMGV
jgi:hypothetical protein